MFIYNGVFSSPTIVQFPQHEGDATPTYYLGYTHWEIPQCLTFIFFCLHKYTRMTFLDLASGQRILTKCRIAELSPLPAANRFVPSWLHLMRGYLDPLESATKRHLDRFICFCTVLLYAQIVDLLPITANGFFRPWPHLIHGSLNPTDSAPKRHLDRSADFTGLPMDRQTIPTDKQTDKQTDWQTDWQTDRPATLVRLYP